MENLRPYKPGPIEPIVRVGENLLLIDRQGYRLYSVAFIEEIPRSWPLVMNGGALVAGAQTAPVSTQNFIDMQYGELGQFRMRVIDDITVQVRQPQALLRFGARNVNAEIGLYTAVYDIDDAATEFYLFEDQRPFVIIRNPTGYNLAQSRISFYGVRYVLSGAKGASSGEHIQPKKSFGTIEDALASGERFTVVPMGGWGR